MTIVPFKPRCASRAPAAPEAATTKSNCEKGYAGGRRPGPSVRAPAWGDAVSRAGLTYGLRVTVTAYLCLCEQTHVQKGEGRSPCRRPQRKQLLNSMSRALLPGEDARCGEDGAHCFLLEEKGLTRTDNPSSINHPSPHKAMQRQSSIGMRDEAGQDTSRSQAMLLKLNMRGHCGTSAGQLSKHQQVCSSSLCRMLV